MLNGSSSQLVSFIIIISSSGKEVGMKKIREIIGHEDIIKYMKFANKNNKLAHAYILSGESGSGKTLLTDLFVKSIMCENLRGDEPCGECITCVKIKNNNHPDVKTLVKEKKEISIGEVREQINKDIEIKPYSSDRKIYVIQDAQTMNPLAQNAILKTIEEPPEYAIIILHASNSEALLQTIQSRCVVLNLKNISDTKIIRYLMDAENLSEYEAKTCAAFAQGNIGKAKKLSKSDEFNEIKDICIKTLTQINGSKADKFNELVKEMTALKGSDDEVFNIITMWYRDILIFKATQENKRVIFQDKLLKIKELSKLYSYEKLEQTFEGIELAKQRIKANINYELVMELLLRNLKEL